MISIMKNTFKIFSKRKGFIITSLILPLILVISISQLNMASSQYKIGFINNDKGKIGSVIEEKLNNTDVIKVIPLENDENYKSDLIFHKFEMIVTIDENFTEDILNGDLNKINIKSIAQSDMEPTIEKIINNEVKSIYTICNNIEVNKVGLEKVLDKFSTSQPKYEVQSIESKKASILDSLGTIFYIIFIVAGLSCSFLLEDELGGTKDRILMGKINEKQYYGGLTFLFFIITSMPAIEYFLICRLLNYKFGFDNKIILLLLVVLFALFAVVFSVFLASFIKKKTVLTLVNSCLMIPIFMLSGCFWPFEMMSENVQKIGSILPPRWIVLAIEKLQAGENLKGILPIIIAFLLLITFLFLLSVFFTRNKIILDKE